MTWRTGKKVFRTIYRHEDGGEGNLIGLMDTPELAREVVDAVNLVAELTRESPVCESANNEVVERFRAVEAALFQAEHLAERVLTWDDVLTPSLGTDARELLQTIRAALGREGQP